MTLTKAMIVDAIHEQLGQRIRKVLCQGQE
jgi:hypothetical protein